MGLCVFLFAYLCLFGTWYWNTGDDYSNGYREGYCTAQGAEFHKPNLCLDESGEVVSVWK